MKIRTAFSALTLAAQGFAQPPPVATLPAVTVCSPRVANQTPVGAFGMPVSALGYEPLVSLQSRGMAEAQADITIRGGIFENSGFRLGAASVMDPQTGHYLGEFPVAPVMLGAPAVLTGTSNALSGFNANVGTVEYGWRRIRAAGMASIAGGGFGFNRQELYQAVLGPRPVSGLQLAADVDAARSESNGSVPYGDHHFQRLGGRIQFLGSNTQTDLYAGYQSKFFGWPNLYTPFGVDETENLQTTLFALNHRVQLSDGEFVELGAYHRRNKDDYEFNRFAPGAFDPYQHTTWTTGAGLRGRRNLGRWALNYSGDCLADDLKSTSLTYGPYHSRDIFKATLLPEIQWGAGSGGGVTLKAGASYDDTNRGGGLVSPIFALSRDTMGAGQGWRRIYLSYTGTSQVPTYTALKSSPTAGLFRGNQELGRETARNLETGISGVFADWQVEAAVFYRQDRGLVDWTYRGGTGVPARTANAVDIDTTGLEIVARHAWANAHVVLGYTFLTKDANYRSAVFDASFYALNFARHRLTAAITLRLLEGWELRWDNEVRIQADNALRTGGGDQALLSSVGLIYRPAFWRGVEWSLQVANLWNSNFQQIPAVPAARKEISLGLSRVW